MQYDKDLYNLSKKGSRGIDTSKTILDPEMEEKFNKLLKILFEKFKSEIKKSKSTDGILITKFYFHFWQNPEQGYTEINNLKENPILYYLLGEYCIYISDHRKYDSQYNSSYYEVIWNYQKYYESLSPEQKKKRLAML